MKSKLYLKIITICLLITVLVVALTACAPKDAASLVKEVENVMTKASDISITDTITLSTLKLSLNETPLNTVTATLSGGNIVLKREIRGKDIDIELTATGIKLNVTPSMVNIAINSDAFKDVTFLFRMRVREEELSYYLLINGLDKVMSDLSNKIEITTDEVMKLDNSAIEVIRLLVKQPLLGNYSSDGEYDKKKNEYSYSYTDNEIINNELTRALNMFIGLDIDKVNGIATFIESIFGSKDIEQIANEIITHNKYNVLATIKSSKYGYYFNTVMTELSSAVTLDNEKTVKILDVLGMDSYLSGDRVKATLKLSIKVNSEWSLSAN